MKKFRFLTTFGLVATILFCSVLLTACGTKETIIKVNGFNVIQILFDFDEDERALYQEGKVEEAAQSLVVSKKSGGTRDLFGNGGVYNELQTALSTLTGQIAINKFYEYINEYGKDPGMFADSEFYQTGYLVPLGQSIYVQPVEQLARSLFNNENPNASIGNAFIRDNYAPQNDYLGYCITEFGVHIIMIKSLSAN